MNAKKKTQGYPLDFAHRQDLSLKGLKNQVYYSELFHNNEYEFANSWLTKTSFLELFFQKKEMLILRCLDH